MDECDDLTKLRLVGESVRHRMFADTSKMSKSVSEFLLGRFSEVEEILTWALFRNERLEGRIEELNVRLKEAVSRSCSSIKGTSYDSVAARTPVAPMVVAVPKAVTPTSYALMVRDIAESDYNEPVKAKLKKFSGKAASVRIQVMRKVWRGAVVVEVRSEEDQETIRT